MNTTFELPIDKLAVSIKDSIENNSITIISTPTGSGKTMRVPFWAFQLSNKTVHCLVPRVVMAKEAQRGAYITTWNKVWCRGNEVAYATGRGDSGIRSAKCVYMTEGSFIHRNIADGLPCGSVVCVDEVHEQGAITEALLVQAKQWADKGLKVVLMSATLDVDKYSQYYTRDGYSVGVLTLPAKDRPYPLEKETVDYPLKAIAQAASNGGRCLVGVDGKATLARTISELNSYLKSMGSKVHVYPFHGELEQEELDKPLNYKGAMIVVATNVLQSGVTISGLSHGYFLGYGNRIENEAGRKALKKYTLSKAEIMQWFGRIGRTCKGTIFQSSGDQRLWREREEMPTAEILRSPLEETVLMFKSIGLDIKKSKCLNQPPADSVEKAEDILKKLKCLDDKGEITKLGRDVFFQGAGLRGGIIQVLGQQAGIANTAKKIAALLGGRHPFRKARYHYFKEHIQGFSWSDHLAWIKIIDHICETYGYKVKSLDYPLFKEKMESAGLFRKALVPLMRSWKYIDQQSKDDIESLDEKKPLIQKILRAAFADSLVSCEYGYLKTDEGLYPRLSNSSQVSTSEAKCAVGEINIIPTGRGSLTLLEGVTIVE